MIPVGDSPRSTGTPWVNYALIAANLLVFLYMLGLSTALPTSARDQRQEFSDQTAGVCYGFRTAPTEADRFICRFGFQPREFFDAVTGRTEVANPQPAAAVLLTIVTAMFLHAGWLHILGNMLFLWVFGDNVEDRLGHWRYFAFYLVAGMGAALVQGWVDPATVIPSVGASGAVAGVLGAYIVWFPRASVRVVFPIFPLFFFPLPIPAVIMIGVWFLQNLLAGFATINEAAGADAGVAWFAHIGGFAFGMLMALAARPRRAPPRWPG